MSLQRWYPNVRSEELGLEIAKRNTGDLFSIHKFGANFSVPAGTEVTLWSELTNPLYDYPTTALTMTIQSASSEDTLSGDGAQIVVVQGVGNDYRPIEDVINLNGTNPVTLSNQYLRVFRAFVRQAGINGVNTGKITIENGGTIYASILSASTITANQTLMALFTIPAGWTGYLTYVDGYTGESRAGRISMLIRKENQPFRLQNIWPLFSDKAVRTYNPPLPLPEKTDIEMRGINTETSQTEVMTGTFDVLLIKNNLDVPDILWTN